MLASAWGIVNSHPVVHWKEFFRNNMELLVEKNLSMSLNGALVPIHIDAITPIQACITFTQFRH